MISDVMTPQESLQTAEAQVRELLRSGAPDADVAAAQAAVEEAKQFVTTSEQRAAQRDRIRGEIKREDVRAARLSLEAKANEAEAAELEKAPTVVLTYEGVVVKIPLAGGRDGAARQVCTEAITRACRILAAAHLEAIGRARATAMGSPTNALLTTSAIIARLRDELRYAAKNGAVEITAKKEMKTELAPEQPAGLVVQTS